MRQCRDKVIRQNWFSCIWGLVLSFESEPLLQNDLSYKNLCWKDKSLRIISISVLDVYSHVSDAFQETARLIHHSFHIFLNARGGLSHSAKWNHIRIKSGRCWLRISGLWEQHLAQINALTPGMCIRPLFEVSTFILKTAAGKRRLSLVCVKVKCEVDLDVQHSGAVIWSAVPYHY